MVRVCNKKSQNAAAAFLPAGLLLIGVGALALTSGAVAARAQGQPTTGFYIGGAAGANIEEDNRFRNGGGSSTDTYKLGSGDLNNHTFLATYRYEFNTPAAAPPPPAQPAAVVAPPPPPAPAARPYEVYFEFDRATLTPDARQVVQTAAQNALRGNATRIVATRHTDTVGTASYNLSLSRRRATAVRAELIRDGISGNLISTSGVGKNDPAIQTGPNVNEPRNRRVEITVQAPGM